MRVAIAEDSPLVRDGLVRLLRDAGVEVTAAVGDADALVRAVADTPPDVAIVDVRMPPSHTTEGLQAAVEIRASHPEVAILVLSQVVETRHLMTLLGERPRALGYLLKDRVSDVKELVEALERLVAGGSVVDPEVVARLVARGRDDELRDLTAREVEILSLMAEGRSNAGIAEHLVVSPKTIEGHVANILMKLGLEPAVDDNRRVLAVLRYMRARP
jgi:DNA-binding NarL/FixJ family response regulator